MLRYRSSLAGVTSRNAMNGERHNSINSSTVPTGYRSNSFRMGVLRPPDYWMKLAK